MARSSSLRKRRVTARMFRTMPVLNNISTCLETKHGNFRPACGLNFQAKYLDLHTLFARPSQKKALLEERSQTRFSLVSALTFSLGDNGPSSPERSRSRPDPVTRRFEPSATAIKKRRHRLAGTEDDSRGLRFGLDVAHQVYSPARRSSRYHARGLKRLPIATTSGSR
jgi:hypothetical protein